jgi:uncharacterized protein YxeA
MKIILISLLSSGFIWSKSTVDHFNEVLQSEVRNDIKKDEERFRKTPMRTPASVEEVPHKNQAQQQEGLKFDRNHRQLGSESW